MTHVRSLALMLLFTACGGAQGEIGGEEPYDQSSDEATGADAIALAARARVWRTSASLVTCGARNVEEDYSSGRYNVHRWAVTLPEGATEIAFARTAGTWQPAIVIALADGTFVTDGEAIASGSLRVTVSATGRSGSSARLTITAARSTSVSVYTTSWAAVDSDYSAAITTRADYTLRFTNACAPPPPPPPPPPGMGWAALHRGLDLSGSHIPRAGLSNSTLRSALGVSVEPYGSVVDFGGRSFVRGTTSHFGGPNDTGVTSTETGAITGERLRGLNNPLSPSTSTLSSRPQDYYYVAMRFDYSQNGRSFWQNARLLVVNPANGRAIVVRPVDWGPNTRTRRVLDLSPQAMTSLGMTTDDNALVSFAAPGSPLGLVR